MTLDQETYLEILRQRREGRTWAEIAKPFGVAWRTLGMRTRRFEKAKHKPPASGQTTAPRDHWDSVLFEPYTEFKARRARERAEAERPI